MSMMDRLPTELLHLICSFLEPANAASFRLINRTCAAVGIGYILPTIKLAWLPESFDWLRAISEHPILRLHVRTIWVIPSKLPEYDSVEDYIGRIKSPFPYFNHRGCDPSILSKTVQDLVEKGVESDVWKRYDSMNERLRELQSSGTCAIFEKVFARLPHIECLRIGPQREPGTEYQVLCKGFDKYLLEPDSSYDCELVTVPLFRSLRSNGIAVKEVWLELNDTETYVLGKDDFRELKAGLRAVEDLTLRLYCPGAQSDHGPEDFENLETRRRELLTSAKHLRTLSFGSYTPDEAVVSFDVGNHTWHHLQSLELKTAVIEEQCFRRFMRRHSGTLKHIRFGEIVCKDSRDFINGSDDPKESDGSHPSVIRLLQCLSTAESLQTLDLLGPISAPLLDPMDEKVDFIMCALPIEGKGIPDLGTLLSAMVFERWSIEGIPKEAYHDKLRLDAKSKLWYELVTLILSFDMYTSLLPIERFTEDGHVVFNFDQLHQHVLYRGRARLQGYCDCGSDTCPFMNAGTGFFDNSDDFDDESSDELYLDHGFSF